MERKILLSLWLVLFATAQVLALLCGIILFQQFFPQQLQTTSTMFENLAPQGLVAGSSIDETQDAQMSTPQATPVSTLTPPIITPSIGAQFLATTPVVTPTSTPTPTSPPVIGIQNGNFADALANWQTRGEVQIFPLSAPSQSENFEGTYYFARLASPENLDWLGAHLLEQTFIPPENHTALEFWYRIHTHETELGFDSPCFVVLINQQAVAWFSAAEASETWRSFAVPLPMTDQPITISFSVGQTGDQQKASWVELTNIYTIAATMSQETPRPLSSEAKLQLSFTNTAEIGLGFDSESLAVVPQFSQKLLAELLIPELNYQQQLSPVLWQPDGMQFEPRINSPDFYTVHSALYAADPKTPWNLPEQVNQLKAHSSNVTVKLWLVLKTALQEVLQLIPVEY